MQSQEVEQMIAKMTVVVVIIQPYQSERLKADNTLLEMFFISSIKDSDLQKRGI